MHSDLRPSHTAQCTLVDPLTAHRPPPHRASLVCSLPSQVESRVGAIRMDPTNLGSSEISGHRRAITNQHATQARDRAATDPVHVGVAFISQGRPNTVAMGSPAASRRVTAVARAPQQSLPPPPPPHLEGAGSSTGRSTANTTVGSTGQILIKPLIDILPQVCAEADGSRCRCHQAAT